MRHYHSALFGETVILATDDELVPEQPPPRTQGRLFRETAPDPPVVYRERELRLLTKFNDKELLVIHAVKRIFRGTVERVDAVPERAA